MTIKSLLIGLGKLVVCVLAWVVGLVLGGMLVSALGLQSPPLPEGFDAASAGLYMQLESPVLALLLAVLARQLQGSFWTRALSLAALAWVANTLNNQIEATFFNTQATGFLFTVLIFLVPALTVSAAVAWLFPPAAPRGTFMEAARAFFGRQPASGWAWRLPLGALLFMPVYYFFGLLVIPFTIEYYRQGLYGLQVPPLEVLLPVLALRSLLFFLACLPLLIAWRGSRRALAISLGLALFYLVGLQSLLLATWMPWALRLPHLLEILADELVYAAALAWLFGPPRPQPAPVSPTPQPLPAQ